MNLSEVFFKSILQSGDEVQAGLLNGMAEALILSCKDSHHFENQVCFISRKLNLQGERLILELAEFVRLIREERSKR